MSENAFESDDQKSKLPRTSAKKQPSVAIIGDSMVRGVGPYLKSDRIRKKIHNVDITGYVYPGQSSSQINSRIRNIPVSDVTVVMTGTCDIDDPDIPQCTENLRRVVDNVSKKRPGKKVIICEIAQRIDKPHLNEKIEQVNFNLSDIVSKYRNVHLLEHDNAVEDFKNDGLHFSEEGTAKFGLNIRHILRDLKLLE